MATNKKTAKKKTLLQNTPLLLTICAAIALAVGLVIGLLIPTAGANIPYTPLNSVKVESLTVNSVSAESPVTVQFKLNGLPKDTQLSLMVKKTTTSSIWTASMTEPTTAAISKTSTKSPPMLLWCWYTRALPFTCLWYATSAGSILPLVIWVCGITSKTPNFLIFFHIFIPSLL